MAITWNRNLVVILLVMCLVSLVMGGVFIAEGTAKSNMIKEAMILERASYSSDEVEGEIDGIIDAPEEARVMARVLREHRLEIGYYTELERDDPKRETILKAMIMENSLNLAQLGYGLTDVVKATGVFMVIIGLTLGVSVLCAIRPSRKTSQRDRG